MKIYIATSGCYSDYSIDAVFTDRKKAEMYCAIHNQVDQDIEEWETEDDSITVDKPVLKRWAGIYNRCGSFKIEEDGYCLNPIFQVHENYYHGGHHRITMSTSMDKTAEQAEKIMQDKFASWKYEKEMGLK